MPRQPKPPDAVGLRLDLSPTDRDRLLIRAAEKGMSMAAFARVVLVGELDRLDVKARKSKGARR